MSASLKSPSLLAVTEAMQRAGQEVVHRTSDLRTPEMRAALVRNVLYRAWQACTREDLRRALGEPEGADPTSLWDADGSLNLQALDLDQISGRVQVLHAAMLPGQSTFEQRQELAVCQAILRALQPRWVH